MALIGNPMDFDRIRQKYESLVYPGGRRQGNYFNDARDTSMGLLNQQQNMSALTSGGFNTFSQDATRAGQGVQFRVNPVTGATEAVIPEYMGGFRTDQQDFLPGTGGFETIYDIDEGKIDPITGRVKPDPVVTNPVTGQTTSILGGGDGRNRDTSRPENYNYVGGSFVGTESLNEDGSIKFGMHKFLPGGVLAGALTSPARQLATLQNISAMNMAYSGTPGNVTGAASDIAKLARDVQDRAERSGDVETAESAAKLASGYSGLSRDTAQANMEAAEAEAEANEDEGFNLGNFFSGLFGGDDKGDGPKGPTGTGVSGAGTDGTGGPDSQYGRNQNNTTNNNTTSGGSPFGGSSSGGPPGTGSEASGGNNTSGGGGGFQGGANPSGKGQYGGR